MSYISFESLRFKQFKNWDPDRFNWNSHSHVLAKEYKMYFNIWWDPDRFNYSHSSYLAMHLSEKFNIWWNSDKFNWWIGSPNLREYCMLYIETWWDCNQRKHLYPTRLLLEYHGDRFSKWWRPSYFPYSIENVYFLVTNCNKYFNMWYRDDVFKKLFENKTQYYSSSTIYSSTLSKSVKVDESKLVELFNKYLKEYKHIWDKDYIIYKLVK